MEDVADPRDPARTVYPAPFLLTTGVLLFLLKLGARRQLKFALRTPAMLENVNGMAGTHVETMEHPDTLDYLLGRLPTTELPALLRRMVRRLIRMKCLDRFRLKRRFLVAIDATGTMSFRRRHCEKCLTMKVGETTIYYHLALEAKLATANGMAISLCTEFIENEDPDAEVQDCELKAFYRLAEKLKRAFPQLAICLLLDGLYLCEPVLRICQENRWAYFITFKEGSMPERWREYRALLELSPENRLQAAEAGGVAQEFAWVEDLDVGDEKMNVLECVETSPEGNVTRFVWATSFRLNEWNVAHLANRGARMRWKIENEGFNEQKNAGYNLEHAYSKNVDNAQNYYTLLQIGQLLEQLIQKGSLLVRAIGGTAKKVVGGVRKLAEYLKESLRVRVISKEAFDVQAARTIQIRLDTS